MINELETRYGVIIQARTSSTRLPGKVLMDIEGQPMLLRQLKRLKRGLRIPKLLVATSNDSSDDPVEQLCYENGFECCRGSLNDVMGRFIHCAKKYDIDYIIRVGGDDPLIDWECCNTLMELHKENPYDFMYASNREGWPYGCAAELIERKALEKIHTQTTQTTEKLYLEHIIPYFFDHPDEFKILKVKAPAEINRPNYYFTVDYPKDIELIRAIFKKLKEQGDYFHLISVIRLIESEPELLNINKDFHHGFDH